MTLKELVMGRVGVRIEGGGVGWDALKGKEEEDEEEGEVQDRS